MKCAYFYLDYTHASSLPCIDPLTVKVQWSVVNQEIDGAWLAVTASVFVPIRVSDAWSLLGGRTAEMCRRLNAAVLSGEEAA